MRAQVQAGSLVGVSARPVVVEVDFTAGLPGFDMIGLPEAAVRESRVRVRAALEAGGWSVPHRRLLVNLAPGDLRKKGTSFDLAIALGVLAAAGLCPPGELAETLVLGELSLAGDVRPVRGVLAQLRGAAARGLRAAIVPAGNAAEAALAVGLEVRLGSHLRDVVAALTHEAPLPRAQAAPETSGGAACADLAEVRGQEGARRALEIAAAGGHHVLMVGPPGAGKTMLARRVPGLLPSPTADEALEIATIAGAAGLPAPVMGGRVLRPFRAPHHTASVAALVGGGEPVRPGEVTLAHGGVLFLDELPELRRDAIEALRITMESGEVHVARVHERVVMPARPLVVAAMNPCPCGWAGDRKRACACRPDQVQRYAARVSGPVLDRFDLHVSVPRVPPSALRAGGDGESSARVRERVLEARERAAARPRTGAGVDGLTERVDERALALLERAVESLGLSTRGWVKVLRVARTVADLGARDRVGVAEVAEALGYRLLDRGEAAGAGAGRAGAGRPEPGRAGIGRGGSADAEPAGAGVAKVEAAPQGAAREGSVRGAGGRA